MALAHRQPYVGPRRPLDERSGGRGRQAGQIAPVDRHDEVAGLQARALRRRGIEDARDQQSAPVGVDRNTDPGEAGRLVEGPVFARSEVVGEAVTKARHGAGDRGVGEAVLLERAVVVARDAVDRFIDDPRVAVCDEHIASETGEVLGVSAQPQPDHEQDRRGQKEQRTREARGRGHRSRRVRVTLSKSAAARCPSRLPRRRSRRPSGPRRAGERRS